MSEEKSAYINITIGETGIHYDANVDTTEVVFWLEVLKSQVIASMFEGENG